MKAKTTMKKILCGAVALAAAVSLSACVMAADQPKDFTLRTSSTSHAAEYVVANAPAVSSRKVIIKGNPTKIRSGPGKTYSVIAKTSKGKSFTYLGSKKDKKGNVWYKIQYTSSKTGWIISSLGRLTNPAATAKTTAKTTAATTTSTTTTATNATSAAESSSPVTSTTTRQNVGVSSVVSNTATATSASKTTATTTAAAKTKNIIISGNPVNIRSGAGKNYAKIGSTSKGKKFKLLDTKKDSSGTVWYKIQYTSSQTGWVMGTLAYIEGQAPKSTTKKSSGKVAYLTFDDGPSVNTMKILDILDRYNVKATFFVIYHGGMTKQYKAIVSRGHTLALHSYTHDYSKIYKSEKAYFADLKKIHDYVEDVTGVDSRIIRFPGGSSNTVSNKYNKGIMKTLKKSVAKKGYYYHDWNVDSTDAAGRNRKASLLLKNVKSGTGKKKVINVLMHDTGKSKMTTVEALPSIIEYLKKQGYSFEAITEDSTLIQHGR